MYPCCFRCISLPLSRLGGKKRRRSRGSRAQSSSILFPLKRTEMHGKAGSLDNDWTSSDMPRQSRSPAQRLESAPESPEKSWRFAWPFASPPLTHGLRRRRVSLEGSAYVDHFIMRCQLVLLLATLAIFTLVEVTSPSFVL